MADDALRPEVVAALSEPAHLPAELVDQVLDASDPERAAAAAELLDSTRAFLEQAGVLKPSASVLDLDYRRMCALAGVFGTIEYWWRFPLHQQRSLGAMLKIVSPERARWVQQVLTWGGFLPPEPEPEE
jgi:hypothetical protein